MKIQAVKFAEDGFMTQPFAMGGEDGVEKFDPNVKYRSCLQNLDTKSKIIWMHWRISATNLNKSRKFS